MKKKKSRLKINELSTGGKAALFLFFLIFCTLCLVPFLFIVSISLSTETDINAYGFTLIPKHLTFEAYKYLFKSSLGELAKVYGTTIFVTVAGTALGLLIQAMAAWALSRNLKYSSFFSFFMYFASLFSGGTVAWYLVCTQVLHIQDTYFALILPYLVSTWNIIMLRTFMKANIPEEIVESVKIDGGGDLLLFFRFIIPLSAPGLATMALFLAIQYWNDWYLPMMLINRANIVNLQFYMQKVMNSVQALIEFAQREGSKNVNLSSVELPQESMRMAICLVAMGPILLASPFFQRFFIKGMTVGAVKG